MSQENIGADPLTLGASLRNQREQKGLTLLEATEATKISPRVLEAIENDDYDNMPADAFCRGFYSIYAKLLGLDPEEIVNRYMTSRGLPVKKKQTLHKPPVRKSKSTPNYAEPAAFSPALTMGLIFGIISFVLICTFLYFGWNPGKFISTKIQDLKKNHVTERIFAEAGPEAEDAATPSPLPENVTASMPDTPATDAGTSQPAIITYSLVVTFNTNGTLQITLDKGQPEVRDFFAGQTLEWQADKEILLSLPEDSSGTILLNGIEIPLPEAQDGKRLLSLPEGLLDQ